jgi:hypothetical protein
MQSGEEWFCSYIAQTMKLDHLGSSTRKKELGLTSPR